MNFSKRTMSYFQVIERIDGFELGKCLNEYYVRHPRGLIDWLPVGEDPELATLIGEIPRDVVGRICEVLSNEPIRQSER